MQGNYFNKIHFQAEERRAVSVQWGAVSGISVYRRALLSVQHAESPNLWLGVLTNNKLFLPSLGNWSIWYSSLFPIFKFHFSTIDKYMSSFYFSNKVCTHTHIWKIKWYFQILFVFIYFLGYKILKHYAIRKRRGFSQRWTMISKGQNRRQEVITEVGERRKSKWPLLFLFLFLVPCLQWKC